MLALVVILAPHPSWKWGETGGFKWRIHLANGQLTQQSRDDHPFFLPSTMFPAVRVGVRVIQSTCSPLMDERVAASLPRAL